MPKSRKPPSQTWRAFLNNHVEQLVSIDFFTVPTATFRVLFVLVVLAQPPLLGIDKVLIQVTGSCDQERLTTLGFGVELTPYQVPETERPVRVRLPQELADQG